MVQQTDLFKANAPKEFLDMCDAALGDLQEIDADELRRRLPREPLCRNWIGAWFLHLTRKGGWHRSGWKRSAGKLAHGRLIPIWKKV